MKSDNVLLRFLVNGLFGLLIGAILIGLIGAILAGYQGFLNGIILGAVFGLIGGIASMGTLENTAWFTGTIFRYGKNRHADEPDE